MAAEKVSVTVDEQLMKWARSTAKRRRTTVSAVVADALELHRQHDAREKYLKKALAGMSADDLERKTAEAYRDIFGHPDAAQ